VVRSANQVDRLVELGLYRGDTKAARRAERRAPEPEPPGPEPTVFERMLDLRERLQGVYRELLREPSEGADTAGKVRRLAVDMRDICHGDTDAALAAVHLHLADDYRYDHPLHVAVLVEVLGERAGLMEDERLSMACAALTHDIGLAHVQGELDRQKGPLTERQWAYVRGHPERAVEILRSHGIRDPIWQDAIRSHHERLDGSGYPAGLKGEEIPRNARILAISDVYSAMIRPRAYRDAVQSSDTLRRLFMERGATVDDEFTGLMVASLGIYPPGTFLRLDSGEIAVAVRRGIAANRPSIYAILSANGAPYAKPKRRESAAIKDVVPANNFRSVWHRVEPCFAH